jgi:hypothetical protein
MTWLRSIESALLGFPRWLSWTLLCLWIALILSLGGQRPAEAGVAQLGFFFNLAHAVLYGLLALWVVLCLPERRKGHWPHSGGGRGRFVLLAVLTVGLVDELHQATVPGRDASVLDLATDLAGASAVWALVSSRTQAGRLPAGLLLALLLLCILAALLATFLPAWIPSWRWL